MFNFDDTKFFTEGCHKPAEHFPCEPAFKPAKPRYTMTEEVEHTARVMRETIERLLKFEERVKLDVDNMTRSITSDNVIFKTSMREAWGSFLNEVKNEINLFESTLESTVALFQKDIESNYATLSEDVHTQILASLTEYSNKLTAFETAYLETFETYKAMLNERIDSYNVEQAEAFADYQLAVNGNFNSLREDINTTVNEAEAFMRTNLNASIDALLQEMKENGDITGIITSDIIKTPEMYGAFGDGVADDTNALQACIEEGNFVLLRGTYMITKTINFENVNNIILYGGKIIRDKDKTFNTIKGSNCSNVHLINVEFEGNGNNSEMTYTWSDNTQACIILAGDCNNIFIEKCKVKNFNYGIFTLGAETTDGNMSINATIRDCYFENCTSGIDTYGKNILIDNNSFNKITGNAIQIEPEGEPSTDNPLADPNFYQCAMSCVISNNMLVDIEGTAIIIHNNVYGVKIDNNTIIDFGQAINSNRSFKGCFVTNNTIIFQKEIEVNSDKRPFDLSYFAVYCGENSVVEGNFLKNCYTAIQGREGSFIKNNTIVDPYVSAIVVSSNDERLIHFIEGNVVKDFTKNTSAWWGAYPIVLNGGKAVLHNNIVYSDCEPVCPVSCQASVKNLISTTEQITSIPTLVAKVFNN